MVDEIQLNTVHCWYLAVLLLQRTPQIARFTWPTWGPPGSCRPQVGLMLAPWILLSGSEKMPRSLSIRLRYGMSFVSVQSEQSFTLLGSPFILCSTPCYGWLRYMESIVVAKITPINCTWWWLRHHYRNDYMIRNKVKYISYCGDSWYLAFIYFLSDW